MGCCDNKCGCDDGKGGKKRGPFPWFWALSAAIVLLVIIFWK